MGKTFYSEYVNHCLKFYVRHPNPKFHNETDRSNWKACDAAFKGLEDNEKEILFYIFSEGDTVPDNVYRIAKEKGIKQDSVWKLVSDVERKVAKKRGLL